MIPYLMLYTVIAGVPILLGAFGIAALLRHYGRPERAVWLGALVLAFALPAASLIDPVRSTPAADPTTVTGVIGLPEIVAVPVPDASFDISRLLVALWLTASLVMAVRWMVATLRLGWTARSWRPHTLEGIPVLMTEDVGPAVSGVLRPRVLVPAWITDLPASERALVLMHEEEHVRARDPMLVAVARAARILAPWNPVVWALTSRLVRAIELDCDRRVLKRTADVAAYGHTLLKMSARRPNHLVAAAAFAESEAPLRSRILSMTTPSRTISVAAISAATVLGVVLLVGALGIPVPTVNIDVQLGPQPDQTPTVTAFDAPPGPPPPPAPARIVRERIGADGQKLLVGVDGESRQLVLYRSSDGQATGFGVEPVDDAAANARRLEGITRSFQKIEAEAAANVQQVPEPAFSPMTVRPQLTNMQEVQSALMREYPAVLRDAGIGGAPTMWIHIAVSGAVDDTRVFETSGNEALDQAALNVARVMRFTPAEHDGAPVAVWIQIPIRFAVVN